MRFIDSHIHLDFSEFDADREELIAQSRALGIHAFVVPGITLSQSKHLPEFAARFSEVKIAAGLHPYFLDRHGPDDLVALADWAKVHRDELVAIGECGLDRSIDDLSKQTALFEGQIRLANELALPLIVHHRQSHDLIAGSFKRCPPRYGGVIHAYSGSLQQAEYYIAQGFKLGVGGVITYSRAVKTRDAIARVPVSSLLLETDAPSMPVAGHQGRRNTPQALKTIFEHLVSLRRESASQLAETLYQSTQTLFMANKN